MKWRNVSFSPILSLSSSFRAQLCKSVTQLALDSCVTKPSLTEFPVYICNLVGIPAMRPQTLPGLHACFQKEGHSSFRIIKPSWVNHESRWKTWGGNVLLKDKKTYSFVQRKSNDSYQKRSIIFLTLEWQPEDFCGNSGSRWSLINSEQHEVLLFYGQGQAKYFLSSP